MKLKTWQVILIVVLGFLILVNVLLGSNEFVPYYPENLFAHQYPYNVEALTDLADASGNKGGSGSPAGAKDKSTVAKDAVKVTESVKGGSTTGASANVKEMLDNLENSVKEKKATADPVAAAAASAAAINEANNPDLAITPVSKEQEDTVASLNKMMKEGKDAPDNPNNKENFDNMYSNRLYSGPSNGEQYFGYLADSSNCTSSSTSLGMSNSRGYVCLSKEQIVYLQSRGGNARGKTDF